MFLTRLTISLLLYFSSVHLLDAQQSQGSEGDGGEDGFALLQPFSDREADAVIRQRALDQAYRESQRLINRINFTVVERKITDLGARKIIINRVEPPDLPPSAPSKKPVEPNQWSEEQLADWMNHFQYKPHNILMVSATVFDRKISELRWWHDGQQYTCWSNVDFNFLRGIGEFETDDTYYTFLVGIGNESTKEIEDHRKLTENRTWEINPQIHEIPPLPPFTPGRAEYFFISDDSEIIEDDEIFAAIDALHAFYDENERELKIQYQRVEALNAAQKRYNAANPEEPEDTVIHFWPKRGSAYQNSDR